MTTRTRTRNSTTGLETKSWCLNGVCYLDKNGAIASSNSGGPYSSTKAAVTVNESMTDTVTQQFKKVSSEGGIVLSPMEKSVVTITDLPLPFDCSYKTRVQSGSSSLWGWYHYTTSGECFSSDILDTTFATPPSLSETANVAISKAFANISLSETQLWASLGEAKETLGMIRDSYKLAKGLLTRDLRTIKRLKNPKEIANAWMALRYGIRPLYYEINGYLKALHAKPPKDCRQTFRGNVSDSISTERIVDKTLRIPVVTKTKQKIDVTVRARAGVLTDVEYLGASQLLGLWEIPQSAWELVPFSFIIDWFLNVGTVIASWTPKPGFKVLGSWVVVETTIKKTAMLHSTSLLSPCSLTTTNGCRKELAHSLMPMYQIESVTTTRAINPSRPILPSFDVRLDYLKILDLAIIMKNLFNKR